MNKHSFSEYALTRIRHLNSIGSFGTEQNYTKTLRSLELYLSSTGGRTLTLEDIDSTFVAGYDDWLKSRGLVSNSVSCYNRVLRAIYNSAVDEYDLPDRRPFRKAFTGNERTKSRSADSEEIRKLMAPDSSCHKNLELTKDLFTFSFLMRGMPFVDMAYLRKADISGGYVAYSRRKTGTRMLVKVETPAMRIIEKYSSQTAGSEYLFPILGGLTGEEAYRRYRSSLAKYNLNLKKLGVDLSVSLTSYVSRHSWATMARDRNVPVAVISEALGHSDLKTTQTYLSRIEPAGVDSANRMMMQALGLLASHE